MARRLAFLLLSLVVSLPLLAGFGRERAVTASDLLLLQEYRQYPRIATDGEGYLVAWYDNRGGMVGVYGARVAADGTLLDPTGFFIARASAAEILWTGQAYVAFWPESSTGAVMARTISRDGILGAPKVALETPKMMGITDFAVATNGSTILLATTLNLGGLLELDGSPIGSLPLAPQTNLLNIDIDIASLGGEYLVAYGMNTGLTTQRVSASGQPSAPVTHPGTPRSATVALTTNGANYLLVASDRTIYSQLLSRENAPVGELRVLAPAKTISGTDQPSSRPAAVWRGSEYLVTFAQGNDGQLFSVRVGADGAPLGAPVLLGQTEFGREPRMISRGGSNGAALWIDRNTAVQFAPLAGSGIGTPKPVSYTAAPQFEPALARAGNQLVAAWREQRPGGEELRIAHAGGEPRVVAPLTGMWRSRPELVFDGETIWMVWIDERLFFRRYTPSLEPIDAAPVPVDPGPGADISSLFTVAAGRDGILVLFESTEGVLTVALQREGNAVFVTKTLIHVSTYRFHHPVAVWDGQRYVVAFAHELDWTWWQMPQPVRNEILVSRISREGVLLDAAPIALSDDSAKDIDAVRIARGGDGAITVAWQDYLDNIYLTRFTGTAMSPVQTLPSQPFLNLGPLVAVANGYVVFRHNVTAVQYERLALDLTRIGSPELFPPFERAYWWEPFYRVEASGDRLFVLYMRGTPGEAPYGGVPRLFWRTDDDGAPRRRAVR